jgi:hypothetical protein
MKTCNKCKSPFEITDKDRQFYGKIGVPEPTLCPDCRQQRRIAWRNERVLYKRNCDLCNKPIVSIYSADKPFTVYCNNCWWSDKWNTLDYGRDFDFNRPFFEQFQELQKEVPRMALINSKSENSEYTNHSADNKNCYMDCDIAYCEDVHYSNWIPYGKNLIDCTKTIESEICYECIDSFSLYNCFFCQETGNSADSAFLFDCRDCHDCIACTGLRNAKNYLFNKKSDAVTIKKIRDSLSSFKEFLIIKKQFEELKLKQPRVFMRKNMSENVSGEFVENCKDVYDSYLVFDSRDCRFVTESAELNDCYDTHSHWKSERTYEISGAIISNNLIGSNVTHFSNEIFYCDNTFNSNSCFGSISLNRKKYCILNKQYSKEGYEKMLPKIIEHMKSTGEWGEFFSITLSPFCYNETIANQYYPMTKEKALKAGMRWKDDENEKLQVEKIISAGKLPDKISDTPDDILNWAIECAVTKKPFRIIPQELKFYRQHSLPVPRLHYDKRYENRISLRNPRKLYDRKCANCKADIRTTYSPDRPETVYCEQCYLKTVY